MNSLEPTSIALKVFHQFKASHSLAGFETPHFHLWKITVEFKASLPLKTDRLIDLVLLQEALSQITAPIANTYLNDTLGASPTSENMALFIWKKVMERFPNDPLDLVAVSLCDLNGESMGEATLS
jgi:6-pyruvoyl-tetrahydropterin synthase